MPAPIVPRSEATVEMEELIWVNVASGSVAPQRRVSGQECRYARRGAESPLTLTPIVLVPADVESLRKMEVVVAYSPSKW